MYFFFVDNRVHPDVLLIKEYKKMSIGKTIRKKRDEKKYTREHLSFLSSVPLSTIRSIELNDNKIPTITTLIRLAIALNISINELIGKIKLSSKRNNIKRKAA
jgi:transcriptional regulator with XRE-family HTH domain